MRGAALPAALLCAALGLFLALVPRRLCVAALVVVVAVAIAGLWLPVRPDAIEIAFAGCWFSVILIAGCVHLPAAARARLALWLAADAGLCAGAVIAAEGTPSDLFRALPAALLCVPGRLIVARQWQIALKVAASWLIAIALLAAFLPTATTPGYRPDHMD